MIVFDHEINISVGELKSDALPGIEGEVTCAVLLDVQRVQMLPEHPETRGDTAEENALDI